MIAVIQVEFPIPNAVYVFNFKANESQELIELAKAQFKKHRIETYLSKETMVILQSERYIMLDDSAHLIKQITVSAKQARKIINRDKYFKSKEKKKE